MPVFPLLFLSLSKRPIETAVRRFVPTLLAACCLLLPVSSREHPGCLAPVTRMPDRAETHRNGIRLDLEQIEAFPEGEKQKEYFIEAVRFFNESLLELPFLEQEHLITLFEILRGDHRNPNYSNNMRLRDNRLETFEHILAITRSKQKYYFRQFEPLLDQPLEFMELVNRRFDHFMHAIAVASKLYEFIIDAQIFGNTHEEYTGFSSLISNREDQYPFDGHHRFAWFVMNYILVKNNVPPVYFTANEVKRDNDHLHAEIILTRAPKQRYDFMQESA